MGFKVAEELARRWELPKAKKKFAGELSEGRTGPGGPRVAVLRPQTYMNEAGRSVGPARGSFKLDLDRLVVVHDEIETETALVGEDGEAEAQAEGDTAEEAAQSAEDSSDES